MQWSKLSALSIYKASKMWIRYIFVICAAAVLVWFSTYRMGSEMVSEIRKNIIDWWRAVKHCITSISVYFNCIAYCKFNFVDSEAQLGGFVFFLEGKISMKKILPLHWGKHNLHLGPWNGMQYFLSELIGSLD